MWKSRLSHLQWWDKDMVHTCDRITAIFVSCKEGGVPVSAPPTDAPEEFEDFSPHTGPTGARVDLMTGL